MAHATFVDGLTDILVQLKAVPEKEKDTIKKLFHDRSQASFDDFLLSEGLVDRENLLQALSLYYNVPYFDVRGHFFDHQLVRMLPKGMLHRNAVIPLEVVGDNIMVVVANQPDDEELLPEFGEYVSYDLQFMVGIRQDITDAISEYYDEAITVMHGDEYPPEEELEEEEDIREIELGEE